MTATPSEARSAASNLWSIIHRVATVLVSSLVCFVAGVLWSLNRNDGIQDFKLDMLAKESAAALGQRQVFATDITTLKTEVRGLDQVLRKLDDLGSRVGGVETTLSALGAKMEAAVSGNRKTVQ